LPTLPSYPRLAAPRARIPEGRAWLPLEAMGH